MAKTGQSGDVDNKGQRVINHLPHRVFVRIKVDVTWKILQTVLDT